VSGKYEDLPRLRSRTYLDTFLLLNNAVKVKVKFTLGQVVKAQGRCRGIALPFL
jgi:hypothetical protein